MRVLITGSSGQIGTNLGLRLQAEGHTVFGVDKRPNTWTQEINTTLQDLSQNYDDFTHGIGSVRYPDNLDIVVHLAAHAKVHELVEYPARALENVTMVFNVLEFCRHHHLPLIYASSREVYGDIHHYITDEARANFYLTESPYSASKISGEAFVYSYARCYDLAYLVFRFSNVYGRYDNDLGRMERVIPLFIDKINRRQPITIFGEHKVLDFTYVDDCISGVRAGIDLLVSGRDKNHTINLAYGHGNSLVSMAQYIAEALDIEPEIHLEPARVGEVTHYVADISKAQTLLDYAPTTPLREGIFRSVAWSREWAAREQQ